MQFAFICKIKPVLFVSVTIYSEFQCVSVTEFLQTDRIGPVPELSLIQCCLHGVLASLLVLASLFKV